MKKRPAPEVVWQDETVGVRVVMAWVPAAIDPEVLMPKRIVEVTGSTDAMGQPIWHLPVTAAECAHALEALARRLQEALRPL